MNDIAFGFFTGLLVVVVLFFFFSLGRVTAAKELPAAKGYERLQLGQHSYLCRIEASDG